MGEQVSLAVVHKLLGFFVLGQVSIAEAGVSVGSLLKELMLLLSLLLLVLFGQLGAHGLLLVVEEAKLEVVNGLVLVEVDTVKDETVVRQGQVNAHLIHARHELPKVERAVEVFVEPPESFGEPLVFLDYAVADMLQEDVDAPILLSSLENGKALQTGQKVVRIILLRGHDCWAVLIDGNNVFKVLVYQNRPVRRLL